MPFCVNDIAYSLQNIILNQRFYTIKSFEKIMFAVLIIQT